MFIADARLAKSFEDVNSSLVSRDIPVKNTCKLPDFSL